MDEIPKQKYNQQLDPKDPGQISKPGMGFFASDDQNEHEAIGEDFLSLSEAGKVTGYHQDYLGFLCRTGKLKGFKIGRNWVTTNSALEEYLKNNKNGISVIADESGRKIQVHIENHKQPSSSANAGNPESILNPQRAVAVFATTPATVNFAGRSLNEIPQLTNLKREVLEDLENRIESINLNLSKLENKTAEIKATESVANAQNENFSVKQAPVFAPVIFPPSRRNELSDKFISNFHIEESPAEISSAPVPKSQFVLTKDKVKDLYASFVVPSQRNLPVIFASLAIALLGLVGSLFWANISTQTQLAQKPELTKVVYQQKANGIEQKAPNQQNGTTVVNNNIANQIINKVLGLSESQVYSLIDQRLNKYLAEGKFKGDKGDTGVAGIAGSSGGNSVVTYIQPNPSIGSGGGSMAGITYLSSQDFTTNNANVNNLLTVSGSSNFTGSVTISGPTTLTGTTTIANLNVANFNPGFAEGSVAFQGSNGLVQDIGNLFYSASTTQLAIGTSTPAVSAILQLESTSKGLLTPRMTQVQRDAIVSPAVGLLIFNITSNGFENWNGSAWASVGSSNGNASVATGTVNSFAYYSSVNQLSPQNILFISGGNLGIGTTTPLAKLDVWGNFNVGTSSVPAFFVNTATGNVGVGTNNPAGAFEVVGQCVEENTKIRRRRKKRKTATISGGDDDDEWEEIAVKDIVAGDEIMSLNEQTGEFEWQVVEKTHNKGMQEAYTLVTAQNLRIETTAEHPYLALVPEPQAGGTTFEVDQSNRMEDSNRDSFVAIANGKVSFTVKLSIKEKKKLLQLHEAKYNSKFGFQVFAKMIGLAVKLSGFRVTDLIIDHEYVNRESEIASAVREYLAMPELGVRFESVGKHSPAHYAAKGGYLNGIVQAVATTDKLKKTAVSYEAKGGHHTGIKSGDSPVHTVLLPITYQKPENLSNLGSVKWLKVEQIRKGMMIATAYGWQKVKKVYKTSRKQMYDLQIANTHNFVGNGIVAHNTAIFDNRVSVGTSSPVSNVNLFVQGQSGNTPLVVASSSGSALLTVLGNGNVGIGTTSPSQKLVVAGDARITGSLFDSSNASGTAGQILTSTGVGTAWTSTSTLASNLGAFIQGGNTFGATGTLGTLDSNALNIITNGTTKMTVLANGNVGIGTANPLTDVQIFDTDGNGSTNLNFNNSSTGVGTNDGLTVGISGGTAYILNREHNTLSLGTGNSGFMTLADGPFVGIGVGTAPNFTLELSGTFAVNSNGSSGDGDRFIVNSSGNVGIGTTTPAQRLSVAGNMRLTGSLFDSSNASGTTGQILTSTGVGTAWTSTSTLASSLGAFIQGGNTFGATGTLGTLDSNALNIITNGTTKMTVLANGNVGIGTTSPGRSLDVNGAIAAINSTNLVKIFAGSGYGVINARNITDAGNVRLDLIGSSVSVPSGLAVGSAYQALSPSNGNLIISGNVGIGTTAPVSTLAVAGTSTMQNILPAANLGYTLGASTTRWSELWAGTLNVGTSTWSILQGGNGRFAINDQPNGAGTERLTVLTSGNVGIGTTNAVNLLTLKVPSTQSTGLSIQNNAGNARAYMYADDSNNKGVFGLLTGAGVTVSIDSNGSSYFNGGNVGIGTTSPGTVLHVQSSNFLTAAFQGTSAASRVHFVFPEATNNTFDLRFDTGTAAGGNSTAAGIIRSTITQADPSTLKGDLSFFTNSGDNIVERMRIDNQGNVGIGTTSPASLLTVGNNNSLTVDNSGHVGIGIAPGASIPLTFAATTGQKFDLYSGGGYSFGVESNEFRFNVGTSVGKFSFKNTGYAGAGSIMEAGWNPTLASNVLSIGDSAANAVATLSVKGAGSVNPFNVASSSGTSLMVINNQGNVGIGTTNPGVNLETVKNEDITAANQLRIVGRFKLADSAGSSYWNGMGSGIAFSLSNNANGSPDVAAIYGVSPTSNDVTTGDLVFHTRTASVLTEKIRILSNGNVGIGTTNPGAMLSLYNNTTTSISLSGGGGVGSITQNQYNLSLNSTVGMQLNGTVQTFAIGGVEKVRIDTNGNVGIGTTTPGYPLSVVNATASSQLFFNAGTTGGGTIGSVSATNFTIMGGAKYNSQYYAIAPQASGMNSYNGNLWFYGNTGLTIGNTYVPTARMYIDGTSGNVGIGTTSPVALLSLNGGTTAALGINFGDATTNLYRLTTGTLQTDGAFVATGNVYGNYFVTGDGSVGIGNGYSGIKVKSASGYSFSSTTLASGAPDLGLFRGAAGKLYVGNGTAGDYTGTLIAGNVGIGTTSPSQKLDVWGNLNVATSSTPTLYADTGTGRVGIGTTQATHALQVEDDRDSVTGIHIVNTNYTANAGAIIYVQAQGSGNSLNLVAYPESGGAARAEQSWIYTGNANQDLVLGTNNAALITLQASTTNVGIGYTNPGTAKLAINGNVGIGTTGPTSPLQIGIDSSSVPGLAIGGGTGVVNYMSFSGGRSMIGHDTAAFGANGALTLNAGTAKGIDMYVNGTNGTFLSGTLAVAINSIGNVGIGTTSPQNTLHIYGTANNPLKIDTNQTQVFANFSINNVNKGSVGYFSSGSAGMGFLDSTGNNIRLLVTDAGNVGIGTTSPQYGFVVGATPALSVDTATGRVGVGGILPSVGTNAYNLQVMGNMGIYTVSGFRVDRADGYAMYAPFGGLYAGGAGVNNYIAGNVGIGTVSPTAKLEVAGSVAATGTYYVGTGTTYAGRLGVDGGTFISMDTYNGTNFAGRDLYLRGNTVSLWTGSSPGQRLTVDSTGNVGIGTTSPSSKLEVVTAATAGDQTALTLTHGIGGIGDTVSLLFKPRSTATGQAKISAFGISGGSAELGLFTDASGGPAERMRIDKSGNVGIGTTAPQTFLDIVAANNGLDSNGAYRTLRLSNSNATPYEFYMGSVSSATSYMGFNSYYKNNYTYVSPVFPYAGGIKDVGGRLDFYNDSGLTAGVAYTPTERLSILTNGNVGIGTTNPGYKLEVSGTLSAATSTLSGITFGTSGSTRQIQAAGYNLQILSGDGNSKLYIPYDTSNLFRVQGQGLAIDGNVGIGTTSPAQKLDVNGNIASNGQLRLTGYTGTDVIRIQPGDDLNPSTYAAITVGNAAWNAWPFLVYKNGNTQMAGVLKVDGTGNSYIQGNVGIGTTGPLDPLSVSAAGVGARGGVISVANSSVSTVGNKSMLGFRNSSAFASDYYSGEINSIMTNSSTFASDLAFNTYDASTHDGREVMRITSTGNVGIGTTGPGASLDVLKTVPNSTITNVIRISNDAVSDSGRPALGFFNTAGNLSTAQISSNAGASYNASKLWFSVADSSRVLQDRMVIDTSGNVGIGTTSPGELLTLNSATRSLLRFDKSNTAIGYIGNSDVLFAGASATDLGVMAQTSGGALNLGTVNGLVMTLKNGNVGIGTTGPGAALDVVGTVRAMNATDLIKFSAGSGVSNVIARDVTDAAYKILLLSGSKVGVTTGGLSVGNSYNVTAVADGNMIISGNVGIGTTSPASLLHIKGTNAQAGGLTISSSAGTAVDRLAIYPAGNYATAFKNLGGGQFIFLDSSANTQFTLDSVNGNFSNTGTLTVSGTGNSSIAGNVGIGTTSPSGKLNVDATSGNILNLTNNGTSKFSVDSSGNVTAAAAGGFFTGNTSYSQSGSFALLYGSQGVNLQYNNGSVATTGLALNNQGNVGIGTTSPVAKLQVKGADILNTSQALNVGGSSGTGLVVTNLGNVGIGTTNPGSKLEVNVPAAGLIKVKSSDSVGYVSIGDSGGVATRFYPAITNWASGGAAVGASMTTYIDTDSGSTPVFTFDGRLNGAAVVNRPLLAVNNYGGSALFQVGANGNVGIGTTSPGAKLHVYGGAGSTNLIMVGEGQGTGERGLAIGYNYNSDYSFFQSLHSQTAYTPLVLQPTSGNVGIGTTSPAVPLDVNGKIRSSTGLLLGSATDGTTGQLAVAAGDMYLDYPGTLHFRPAGTPEKLTILSSGNVGIGTTSPSAKLHVYGTGAALLQLETTGASGASNSSGLRLIGGASNADWFIGTNRGDVFANGDTFGIYKNFGTSGAKLVIQDNGNVGIGTTSPQQALDVYGVIQSSFNSSFYGQFGKYGTSNIQVLANNDAAHSGNDMYFNNYGANAGGWTFLNSTVNTGVVKITSTGNVGIGTTGPTKRLEVMVAGGGTELNGGIGLGANGTHNVGLFGITNAGVANTVELGSITANDLQLITGNTARVYINGSDGNVGIGTTSPSRILEIQSATPLIRLNRAGSYAWDMGVDDGTYSSLSNFIIRNNYRNTVPFVIDQSNGNVGIGTTGPVTQLHIEAPTLSAETNVLQLQTASNNTGMGMDLSFGFNDTGGITPNGAVIGAVKDATTGKSLIFKTSAANAAAVERVRIDGNGNVGIGTTSPAGKLDVFVASADASTKPLMIGKGTAGNYVTVLNNGNVGIGTTSPGATLAVLSPATAGYSGNNLQIGDTGSGSTYYKIGRDQTAGNTIGFLKFSGQQTGYGGYYFTNIDSTSNVVINNSGNVGIGTTSPAEKLEVTGGNILIGNTYALKGRLANGNEANLLTYDVGNVANIGPNSEIKLAGSVTIASAYGGTTSIGSNPSAANGVGVTIQSLQPLTAGGKIASFKNYVGSMTELAYIGYDGSAFFNGTLAVASTTGTNYILGNVGIGTTNPLYNLHVVGTLYGSGQAQFGSVNTPTIGTLGLNQDFTLAAYSGKDIVFQANGGAEWMRIKNGNVGIGTTSPLSKLVVKGSGATSATSALNITDSNNVSLAYMLNDGSFGLGTTTPSSRLVVNGHCVTGDTLLPIRRRRKKRKAGELSEDEENDGFEYLTVQIKDVLPGDEVMSLNETTGLVEYHRINAVMDMGVQEIYELRTKSGRVIRTTANHPYLARLRTLNGKAIYTDKNNKNDANLWQKLVENVSRIAGANLKNGETRAVLIEETRDMSKSNVDIDITTNEKTTLYNDNDNDNTEPSLSLGSTHDISFIAGQVENQKVLAGEGQDFWWRRQVGSNHTPQGGANQLSGDGHNLMASTSQSYRQNNSTITEIKNNLSNKGEVVSGPIAGNVTPPDKYSQYSIVNNSVKFNPEEKVTGNNLEPNIAVIGESRLAEACPYCNSKEFVKRGTRKNKLQVVQLYLCKNAECGKTFTAQDVKGKHFPLNVIIEAMSYYNLGLTLEQACSVIKQKFGARPEAATLSEWIQQYKQLCRFERLRPYAIKYIQDILEKAGRGTAGRFNTQSMSAVGREMVEVVTMAHRQLYRFRYHRAKTKLMLQEFRNRHLQPLKEYLDNVSSVTPHQYFQDGERMSEIKSKLDKSEMVVKGKFNYANRLAAFVLQAVSDNKQRHEELQRFMLANDSCTVATEVPVYIRKEDIEHMENDLHFKISEHPNADIAKGIEPSVSQGFITLKGSKKPVPFPKLLTGHIDFVQIRNGQIHLLDYKPNAAKEKPIEQLTWYALAMSRLTGLRLFDFTCAWFDEKDFFQFYPLHVVKKLTLKSRKKRKVFFKDGTWGDIPKKDVLTFVKNNSPGVDSS